MADGIDQQAAEAIEHLFHLPNSMVWDLCDTPPPADSDARPIQDAHGDTVAYARPVAPPNVWL